MDTSEKYIKMSDCPEIQDWKIYHLEGFYCVNRDTREIILGWFLSSAQDKHIVWLPQQDDLQTIAWDYYDEVEGDLYSLYIFFREFMEHYYWHNTYPCEIFDSFEQLWLAFVMKSCYNKIWNGEKGEEGWIPAK